MTASSATESGLIFDTGLGQFDREVIENSHAHPVVVDFWADWCPPCRALTPVLERVVAQYGGRIRLAKVEVDADDNMKLAGRYGLRGFPTVLLFVKGEIAGRFVSAPPDQWGRDFTDTHAGLD